MSFPREYSERLACMNSCEEHYPSFSTECLVLQSMSGSTEAVLSMRQRAQAFGLPVGLVVWNWSFQLPHGVLEAGC